MSYKLIHFVFAFKYRKSMPDDICRWLEDVVEQLCTKYGGKPQAVSIHDNNHIHILVDLPPKIAESDFIRNVKSRSCYLANQQFRRSGVLWQKRYLYRSVGQSGTKATQKYINRFIREEANQPHDMLHHVIQIHATGQTEWQASPKEDSEWPF